MMLNLLFIPEIILSIGVMIIILFDLFFQKQKGFSFALVQFILLIAAYYSLNNKLAHTYSAYTLSEFTNIFKFYSNRIIIITPIESIISGMNKIFNIIFYLLIMTQQYQ